MNNTNSHIEQIDRYINKELSKEEQAAFEAQLAVDEALKREYEHHCALQKGINYIGDKNLKALLEKTHHNFIERETKFRTKLKYYFIIGTAGLFCLILGIIIILNPPSSAKKRKESKRARVFSYKEKFHNRPDLQELKRQETITTSTKKTDTNISSKIHFTNTDTLFIPVSAYAPITEPTFILNDSALLLYGIELHKTAHIFLQNNRQLLINNSSTYPITEVHQKTTLSKTHIRINESVIRTKNLQTIKCTQHLFEKIPHDYSIKIHLTNQPHSDSIYSFHKHTITMGQNSFKQIFPNKINIIHFNDHYFIEHNHHLYTLEDGDLLQFSEKNIDHDIKWILSPQTMNLPIITETVENLLDLESSN